ncbi:MAG: CDP-alcohol phosphatidyltransferase family protein [Ruminococcus sp.]|nr:CDP-alcohol phosphatidyltransferase family protein [Candidatus Apopatosoma intestinale]
MIADIITFSRMLFSLLLLVFPPYSSPFTIFYLLCGVSDVLDGFAARRLHTESEKGAMLDSVTDLFFAVVYAVKILPLLSVPLWIWIWTAIIAVIKVTGILIASKKVHRLEIEHSFGNKLTGVLLFLLPLSVCVADVRCGATLVCAVATVTGIREIAGGWRRSRKKETGHPASGQKEISK